MNLNATLLGQMLTFAVFVWFTMKYVWPPITKAMHDREKKIADGLAAGERGQHDLELAQVKATEILKEAKDSASQIIEQTNGRASHMIQEAKEAAVREGDVMIARAQTEITQQYNRAKEQLRVEAAQLALSMAEKIVQRDIDLTAHKKMIDQMVEEA